MTVPLRIALSAAVFRRIARRNARGNAFTGSARVTMADGPSWR